MQLLGSVLVLMCCYPLWCLVLKAGVTVLQTDAAKDDDYGNDMERSQNHCKYSIDILGIVCWLN